VDADADDEVDCDATATHSGLNVTDAAAGWTPCNLDFWIFHQEALVGGRGLDGLRL